MDDVSLLRDEAGTARERDPGDSVDELELETAIARNVRESRIRHGLSVADMAERVGISKAMMSKIENAQTSCSLGTLKRVSEGNRHTHHLIAAVDAAEHSAAAFIRIGGARVRYHHGPRLRINPDHPKSAR